MNLITVSTVTPVYRGVDSLRDLVAALDAERQAWQSSGLPLRLAEVILVDDGSSDGSAAVIEALAREHHWVRPISLSRNFGQHAATMAGILHASGDWVVTLDEDLQHPPAYMLTLLCAAVRQRADVVYAQPSGRVHTRSWYRDTASRLVKALLAHMSGNDDVRLFNSFRAIRGAIARAASSVSVHDTYLDMLLTWFTDRITATELPISDRRPAGRSGYGLRRLLSHARRLLISARTDYLRAGTVLGVLGMLVGAGLGLHTVATYLVAPERIDAPGWSSLFVAVTFFGGLSTLLVGILFEYFSTVLKQAQGKPTFFVVDRSQDRQLLEQLAQAEALARARAATC